LSGRPSWKVWAFYGAALAVVMAFAFVASASSAFQQRYPKYADAAASWPELLLWEGAYAYQFVLVEFFFRGFFLFTLARYVGHGAIFIMVVPYAMIHFAKPLAEALGSIVAGAALGTLALRTRSIAGGIVVHTAVAWSMDLFVLWRKGALARLIGG
jgi:hypothetical protein